MIESPESRAPDVMRRINELMWTNLDAGGRDEPFAFFCECADPRCYRSVWLTPAAYLEAKDDPECVLLAADHLVSSADRTAHRYRVVCVGSPAPSARLEWPPVLEADLVEELSPAARSASAAGLSG